MGRFAGLGSAQGNQGGLYFLPGSYLVKVRAVKFKKTRKGDDVFIVETEVLESDNPSRPRGCCPSWVVNMRQDAAPGNIKAFLGASMGIADVDSYSPDDGQSPDAFWDAAGELGVSSSQPLAGTILPLTCVNITTKAGHDFTKHNWGVAREAVEQPTPRVDVPQIAPPQAPSMQPAGWVDYRR